MPAIVKPASISWTDVFKRTWKEANEDDVLGRSAQLAYYFFLALFPLLICVVTVLGVLAGKGAHVREVSLLCGAELNAVIEDAASTEGEPDAKAKGEKAPDVQDKRTKSEGKASRASA